jgi:colanic acid/amylovoran biosynthesis glycosyltransferase
MVGSILTPNLPRTNTTRCMNKKPLHIAFFAIDHKGFVSGVNTWIKNLALELKKKGHRPLVIIQQRDQKGYHLTKFCQDQDIAYYGLNVRRYVSQHERAKKILSILKVSETQYWLPGYIQMGFFLKPYLAAAGIKTVLVLHSDDDRYKSYFNEFVVKKGPYQVDGLVSVSEFLDSWSLETSHDISREIIGYGVTIPSKQKVFQSDHNLRLVFCGRLVNEQKRIMDVFNAFELATSKFSNVEARFIGDGPEKSNLIQRIKKSASNRIMYEGNFPNWMIQDKLIENDVLVLLSDYEGLPLVLLEAMSVGMIAISLQMDSGLNELIVDKQNGLIVKDRKSSFTDSLSYLLSNRNRWSQIGDQARNTIYSNFSVEIAANKWVNYLQSIGGPYSPELLHIPKKLDLPQAYQQSPLQILFARCVYIFFSKANTSTVDRLLYIVSQPKKSFRILKHKFRAQDD